MKKRQEPHRTAYVLFAILVAFATVVGVGGAACLELFKQQEAKEKNLGNLVAAQAGQALATWLDDQVSLARVMAEAACVRQVCQNPRLAQANGSRADTVGFLKRAHAQHPEFSLITVIPFFEGEDALVLDVQGEERRIKSASSMVDSVDGISLGVGDLSFYYIRAIYEGNNAFISEAKPNAIPGLPPVFMVAVPIYNDQGKLSGCLAFGIKVPAFSSFVVSRFTDQSTGYIELMDQQGRYLGHQQQEKLLRHGDPALGVLLNSPSAPGFQFTLGSGPEHWLYSVAEIKTDWLSEHRWWVLYRRNQEELRQALFSPIASLVGLGLLLFMAAVAEKSAPSGRAQGIRTAQPLSGIAGQRTGHAQFHSGQYPGHYFSARCSGPLCNREPPVYGDDRLQP